MNIYLKKKHGINYTALPNSEELETLIGSWNPNYPQPGMWPDAGWPTLS